MAKHFNKITQRCSLLLVSDCKRPGGRAELTNEAHEDERGGEERTGEEMRGEERRGQGKRKQVHPSIAC